MLEPIVSMQSATPIASIQQHTDSQGVFLAQNASKEVREEERQIREDVLAKEDGVYYEHQPDAREKGNNTYSDMFRKKKKQAKNPDDGDDSSKRVNIDIKL